MLRYTVVLEQNPEDDIYTVTAPALPGMVTQGATLQEALERARDAIALHLEGMLADGEDLPDEGGLVIVASVDVPAPRSLSLAS